MEAPISTRSDEQFVIELKDCAKLLVEKLQNHDFEDASALIHSMVEVRDRHIFKSVGQLTRALHNAIVNFHVDAQVHGNGDLPPSEIRDATDRLQYVITMTQEAAEKTMDRVEASAPIAMSLGQEALILKKEWDKLRRREINRSEFADLYERMGDFLKQMNEGAEQLNENLQAIILEQGFQDLTGQVLKKVIGLITDVEKELVNLMRIAGQVEEITGISGENKDKNAASSTAAEGPQIHANKRDDVVNGQDDVDDLLSSLGF
jgi:chemotaxis protein CheZ